MLSTFNKLQEVVDVWTAEGFKSSQLLALVLMYADMSSLTTEEIKHRIRIAGHYKRRLSNETDMIR